MTVSKRLLIVAHAPSTNAQALADAARRGASHADIAGVAVTTLAPLAAGPDDVLNADALILGTTENFGYMSGALKDFFDRIYYPCLDKTQGLPYALFVRAGNDGSGALNSVERIVTGLRWRAVCEPVIAAKTFRADYVQQCEELGLTLAAGLEAGVF